MGLEESINNAKEYGVPILNKLFDIKSNELRTVIKDICNDDKYKDLINAGVIEKISRNDTPYEISFWFYGSQLNITPFGIKYKPEHGYESNIVSFNKYFKL